MKKIIIILILLLFNCTSQGETDTDNIKGIRPFIIWSHSDIQPKKNSHLKNFSEAVKDVSSNIDIINIAITAGDIVEKKKSAEIYKGYLKTRQILKNASWFTIAGNHEAKDITAYQNLITPDLHYSVKAGNILIIFLSNSEKGQMTVIPDRVIEWWKRKVIENQDKIIITVTHASLENSGLLQSRLGLKRQFIKNSKLFEDILKKYTVDLWISGHSHFPGFLPYTIYKNDKLNGTVFIDNGAIREDTISGMESRILYLYPESNKIIIRHRDHKSKTFSNMNEKEYKHSKKFSIPDNHKIEIDEIIK